jgi:hypothetical protein
VIQVVIAGLDPAIHYSEESLLAKQMDTRLKSAYDILPPLTLRSSFSPKLPSAWCASDRSFVVTVVEWVRAVTMLSRVA